MDMLLTRWLVGMAAGSFVIVAVAFAFDAALQSLPAFRDGSLTRCRSRSNRARTRLAHVLSLLAMSLAYGALLWIGLARQWVALLLLAQFQYIFTWGLVLRQVSCPSQSGTRGESETGIRFDESALNARRQRISLWFGAFMAISVAIATMLLSTSFRELLCTSLALCSKLGPTLPAAMIWLLSVVGIILLDGKYGATTADDLLDLISAVAMGASFGHAVPPLAASLGPAQLEQGLRALLRVEEQAQAAELTESTSGRSVDLLKELPVLAKQCLEKMGTRSSRGVRRCEESIRSLIARLRVKNPARADAWAQQFPDLAVAA